MHAFVLQHLPGTAWINDHPFVLLETDKFTLRYVNKGKIDAFISVDTIHDKMRSKFTGSKRYVLVAPQRHFGRLAPSYAVHKAMLSRSNDLHPVQGGAGPCWHAESDFPCACLNSCLVTDLSQCDLSIPGVFSAIFGLIAGMCDLC